MKPLVIICLSLMFSSTSAATLTQKELLLLHTILRQDMSMDIHAAQEASDRITPLKLALQSCPNVEDLNDMMCDETNDQYKRLNAARGLAYLGDHRGKDLLQNTLYGQFAMSSSGFEKSKVAICLLYLGHKFEDGFAFSGLPNPLYPELDAFLVVPVPLLPEHVVTSALERGFSLVVADINSVQSKQQYGTDMYYYDAKIRQLVVPGDLSINDVNDTVQLFAGASYGQALTVGRTYVLFVAREALYSFSWGHRDDILQIDVNDAGTLDRLMQEAQCAYSKTPIISFRQKVIEDSNEMPTLTDELLSICKAFKQGQGDRCALARSISDSDLGSHRDESQPWSSVITFLPPKIQLTRAQVLSLLGEPTLKCGYTYKWYCGKDSATEADDVGILVCTFDKDERTEFLVYVNNKPEEWVRPGNSIN